MKKIFTLLFSLLVIVTANAGIVFSEDFSGFTKGQPNGSADGSDVSSSMDTYTQQAGWAGSKVYQAGGAAKMGTSSVLGWIQTPAIDLSAEGGTFSVSFDAMAWSGDSKSIKIYLDDVLVYTESDLPNSASYVMSSFGPIELTGGTASSKIKIEGNQASKGRFFIDNLVITQGATVLPSKNANLSDLKVNGTTIPGFLASKLSYIYLLPEGTTTVPTVEATVEDSKATYQITPASSLPGTTNILVTAEDQTVIKGYSVNFYLTDNDGSQDRPFSIAEAQALQGEGSFWIKGYIVGCVVTTDGSITQTVVNSNLALGSDELGTSHMSVQLPAGTVREALNLESNPGNLGKMVSVYGSLETYCGIAGIKNVSDYVISGAVSIDPSKLDLFYAYASENTLYINNMPENATVFVYDATGKLVAKSFESTVSLQQKGIYAVKVVSNGTVQTFKVINK